MYNVGLKFNKMIIEAIEKHFWYLVMTRGIKHTFIGMEIELLDGKTLVIVTKNYIQGYIDLFDEDVSTKVLSAENKIIHEVNPYSPILLVEYRIVMKNKSSE